MKLSRIIRLILLNNIIYVNECRRANEEHHIRNGFVRKDAPRAPAK